MNKAIFLDRDGTLNYDAGYTHKIEDWRWLPGAKTGLKKFYDAGWTLIVVSNQSGIGRGYYKREDLARLENWLNGELAKEGIKISAWRYCPHLPNEGCACRKPEPELLLGAAKELNVDLKRSWMIGDRMTDARAGLNAGCRAGLILYDKKPEENEAREAQDAGVILWRDLAQAAEYVLAMPNAAY